MSQGVNDPLPADAVTIHAGLVTMRINKAKALLHDSGYSQEQIAEPCG